MLHIGLFQARVGAPGTVHLKLMRLIVLPTLHRDVVLLVPLLLQASLLDQIPGRVNLGLDFLPALTLNPDLRLVHNRDGVDGFSSLA